MKKENLKRTFAVIILTTLVLGLSWAPVGLAANNTQAMADWEFVVDTPFSVNNPFPDWRNKLNDPYYKNIVIEKLSELGVGWVSDSVFRKKVEELNWDYINENSYTNETGEIFFSFLPAYNDLVKTDFVSIYDNLVDAFETAGVKIQFVINPKTSWQIKEIKRKGKTDYQLLENVIIPETDIDYSYYEVYLSKLLSRYGIRVASWNIFNEPSNKYLAYFKESGTTKKKGQNTDEAYKVAVENYAKLVEITYPIIKDINSDASVILGGASAMQEVDFYADVLTILQEKKNRRGDPLYGTGGFDAWDFHTYGVASEYKKIWAGNNRKAWPSAPRKYANYREETYRYYELYRDVLNHSGFGSKPLISKEGATYTGEDPYVEKPGGSGRELLLQDEADQAAFLVKRAVHLLSKGVKLINWSTILEHMKFNGESSNFFNYTGLIYNGLDNGKTPDPGEMVSKLSFYTYKFLIEKLKDANWDSFRLISSSPISSGSNFEVSVYEFTNNAGETKFLAWVDYYYYDNDMSPPARSELQLPITTSLNLPALAGEEVKITKAVPNAEKVFGSSVGSVSQNGMIDIELNKEPVYIELNQSQ